MIAWLVLDGAKGPLIVSQYDALQTHTTESQECERATQPDGKKFNQRYR